MEFGGQRGRLPTTMVSSTPHITDAFIIFKIIYICIAAVVLLFVVFEVNTVPTKMKIVL